MKRIASRTNLDDSCITHQHPIDAALCNILEGRGIYAKSGRIRTQWRGGSLRHPQLNALTIPKAGGRVCGKHDLKQMIEQPLLACIRAIDPTFEGTGAVTFRLNNGEFAGLEIITK